MDSVPRSRSHCLRPSSRSQRQPRSSRVKPNTGAAGMVTHRLPRVVGPRPSSEMGASVQASKSRSAGQSVPRGSGGAVVSSATIRASATPSSATSDPNTTRAPSPSADRSMRSSTVPSTSMSMPSSTTSNCSSPSRGIDDTHPTPWSIRPRASKSSSVPAGDPSGAPARGRSSPTVRASTSRTVAVAQLGPMGT